MQIRPWRVAPKHLSSPAKKQIYRKLSEFFSGIYLDLPYFCDRGVSPFNSPKAIAQVCLLGAVLRLFLNPQCSSMILANTQWPHMKFHWCSFLLSVSNKQTACQLQHYLEWHCQTHGYKTSDCEKTSGSILRFDAKRCSWPCSRVFVWSIWSM